MKKVKLLTIIQQLIKMFIRSNHIQFTNENWEYETKCRRCSNLTVWHFSDKNNHSWSQFMTAIQDYIEHPRIYNCKKCKAKTVQDITAHN